MDKLAEVSELMQTAIADIYQRPRMYGLHPFEVECTLSNFHLIWAIIHNRRSELEEWKLRLTPEGRKSLCGSFVRLLLLQNASATEREQIDFTCIQWKQISLGLGIISE